MNDLHSLVKRYLEQINIMQLATSLNDVSWTCTVHYYSDEALNIYWMSTPNREHSQNIAKNSNVSAAILVHENTVAENYVIGISLAGRAELVGSQLPAEIGEAYINKLGKDPSLLSDISNGQNPHQFYCLTPQRYVLFDSQNFPNQPRQVLEVT